MAPSSRATNPPVSHQNQFLVLQSMAPDNLDILVHLLGPGYHLRICCFIQIIKLLVLLAIGRLVGIGYCCTYNNQHHNFVPRIPHFLILANLFDLFILERGPAIELILIKLLAGVVIQIYLMKNPLIIKY